MMKIARDFREFAACLNDHEVRYLVVGGYAVGFHGHPRYTKDLDVWIDRTSKNVISLLEGLEAFGFGSIGLDENDFMEAEQVIQLGYPPLRIDLLTSLEGVEFGECYDDREILRADDVDLPVIGLEALRANKQAVGRHQDLADLEKLI